MKLGFLYSLIRPEEKFLLRELRKRPEIDVVLLDDRTLQFNLANLNFELDVMFNRSMSSARAQSAVRLFECMGIRCVNTFESSSICGDKLVTSAALRDHGIPQPEVRVAFSEDAALQAMQEMGFPVVLKPAVGSWGRLLSKVNDIDAATTILEHKRVLGTYQHSIFYIQKFVEKAGRDIRSIMIGGKCVAAAYRTSEHWITNAARGAVAVKCELNDELREISERAAIAVKGEIVGVDLFETNGGYLVNEVNDTMEFKSTYAATQVDIPGMVVDYLINSRKFYSNGKVLNPTNGHRAAAAAVLEK